MKAVRFLSPTHPRYPLELYRIAANSRNFQHLGKLANDLTARFREYDAYARRLHLIPSVQPPVSDHVVELADLYHSTAIEVDNFKRDRRREFGPGCPYCGQYCSTPHIDHYLPETLYGEFSLYSPNLIPSCSECNTKLSSRVGATHDLINPFEDDFLDRPALQMGVLWTASPFRIALSTHPTLDWATAARLQTHMLIVELPARFSYIASFELLRLNRLHSGHSAAAVRAEIIRDRASYMPSPGHNSWPVLVRDAVLNDAKLLDWVIVPDNIAIPAAPHRRVRQRQRLR
jgi:hypothetical protein